MFPLEVTQALIAYGLAKKAGLKHVTYVSVFKADQFLEVPHFAAKYAVEVAIRFGGMPYTILRPAYFAQNERRLKPVLTGLGVYPIPAGNQGPAVVDVRDLAEAAAISLKKATTQTSMVLKSGCGKQGVRVGRPTMFEACTRVLSSGDSATRRTRRRVLLPCLGASQERTAASLKN
jgi:NmrA-like family